MSTQHVPIGFVDEAGEPVLLPKPKAWLGTKDQAYSAALERARSYYASDLLYSADDFNALKAQRDELLAALNAAHHAMAEVYHAQTNPNWFTHGQKGASKHEVHWLRKGIDQAREAIAKAKGDGGASHG